MTLSRLKNLGTELVPVNPGEGPAVWLSFLANFLAVAGIMLGRNARDSLFLIYFGVRYLPYMYFANAAFLILCSLAYTALLGRMDRGRFLGGISAVFIMALCACRAALLVHPQWFFPVLYMTAQVIWYFTLMQFWTYASDLFNTRQAKRLFPLLGTGALLGMISVGAVSRPLVGGLGTENLLLVWAGLIFISTVLAGIAYRRYRIPERPEEAVLRAAQRLSEWQNIREGFGEVTREPLLRSMAGYVFFMWTVYAVVDFSFNQTMRGHYQNPNDLTTFFGIFVGAQGLLCLLIQLLMTRPVISRLGVGSTINFHPGFLLAGTAWMSARYGFASVLTTKLGDASMLYTFSDSSYQLLYNPISPARRARVRGFIEGTVRPLSLAAAGALVLAGVNWLSPLRFGGRTWSVGQQLSWGAFLLSAVWLGFALTAGKGYAGSLLENLRGESPALRRAAGTALGELRDPASLRLLSETLSSERPDRVLAAMSLLEGFGTEDAAATISHLLRHSDARVRAMAARALGRIAPRKYHDALAALLGDPEARVRANAVEALGGAADALLVRDILPLLRDASTRVRANAALALAALPDSQAAALALPVFTELAGGDRNQRAAAAFALQKLPGEESKNLLAGLLADPDTGIRCRAARALERAGDSGVIPELVEALAGPAELRHEARRSLAEIVRRGGPESVHEIVTLALGQDRPVMRSELADVLGRLNDPQVIDPLIHLLKDPEWRVRWKALKAFGRISRSAPLPERARTALLDCGREELKDFRRTLGGSESLALHSSDDAERLLTDALAGERLKIEERVFRVLGILADRKDMKTILLNVNSPDELLRADALEALDTLAPKPLAGEFLELLEPARAAVPSAPLGATLRDLAEYSKAWVRACVANYLGSHGPAEGQDMLPALLRDRDPVVREMALYAGWRALGGAWKDQVEAALRSPDPLLGRCARRIKMEMAASARPGRIAESNLNPRSPKMLLTVEKVLFLRSVPLFADLPSEELAALAEIALEYDYQAGEVLFGQGDVAHHLYVLVQGKVDVLFRTDSRERLLATIGEKECFGELALLDDEPRSASVRAAEPAKALKIDRESFRELIFDRPQIAFGILKILSLRLRRSNEALEEPELLAPSRHVA